MKKSKFTEAQIAFVLKQVEEGMVMYSLIVTAKMSDVDPQAWLGDVLARLPCTTASRVPELLPWNWSPTRQRVAA